MQPAEQHLDVSKAFDFQWNCFTTFCGVVVQLVVHYVVQQIRLQVEVSGVWRGLKWSSQRGVKDVEADLQWTMIGPSCPNCSLVLCTWPMSSMNPSPLLGTPWSGQSVNWNCRTVRHWPSWTPQITHHTQLHLELPTSRHDTIRHDRWFALENWQASCQFHLAHKQTKNVLNETKKVKKKFLKIKKQTVMGEIRGLR